MTEYYSNVARNRNLKNTCLPSSQSVAVKVAQKLVANMNHLGKWSWVSVTRQV